MRGAVCILSALVCLSLSLGAAAQNAADEARIEQLWNAHIREPEAHDKIIRGGQQIVERLREDPLRNVAAGICSWHLLKAGRSDDAQSLLESMLTDGTDPLSLAAADIARAWLTRIDRERVMRALDSYYREHVKFPASLDVFQSLPEPGKPPLRDRWETEWDYALSDFKLLKGLKGQKYVLQSKRLREASDLQQALLLPYASTIRLEAVRISPGATPVVQFRRTETAPSAGAPSEQSVYLSPGAHNEDITLAHFGKHLIILADTDYWAVRKKP